MLKLKFPYMLADAAASASQKRFNVISTFSGGGGSSLGYKLAGGDVLLANEFVPIAAETYSANFPDTPVIIGDIKQLTGKDFLDRVGLTKGELDVFDGSPPCSAFSTAGSREKGWGKEKDYSTGMKITNIEDLFFEFIRIANEIQPKIIIAENVEGLQFAASRKKLHEILNAFDAIGYVSNFKTIAARDFGVAQNRPRTIIVCVRQDIFDASGEFFPSNFFPEILRTPRKSVREAFEGLVQTEEEIQAARDIMGVNTVLFKIMSAFPPVNDTNAIMGIEEVDPALTKNGANFFNMRKASWNIPASTITATHSSSGIFHPGECRKFTLKELFRLMALPDDYISKGTLAQISERVGRMHSPFPLAHVANHIVKTYLGK